MGMRLDGPRRLRLGVKRGFRRLRLGVWRGGLTLVVFGLVLVSFANGQAGDGVAADVAARLAAGEVPAALAEAEAAPAQHRDAAFVQIANHLAPRDRAAAARAMTQIADDSLRGQTAASIRSAGGRVGFGANLFNMPGFPGMPGAPGDDGAGGGAGMADFDPLIDLIKSTIAPTTWDDIGGPGAIDGFEGGVAVDPSGLMRPLDDPALTAALRLAKDAARRGPVEASTGNPRRASPLRMVSLPRLERHLQRRWALNQPPTETMRTLAGLTEVRYLFFYEETGDIVIAGPAEDVTAGDEGRRVGVTTARPVLSLDDLAVLLRCAAKADGRFGCSITPRKESLAATQQYLNETARRSLAPGERPRWVRNVREKMGQQDITVYGVAPDTRVARVIVEADYHMKLVGLGIKPSVLGVEDYLSLLAKSGKDPGSVSVLRWWFTLKKDPLAATADRTAFALAAASGEWRAQVQSENERLTAEGERVHTGKAEEVNAEFAHKFTAHYGELAAKYPIYAEMENIFDLAVVALAIREHGLADQAGWTMSHLLSDECYAVAKYPAAKTVETVANAKVIGDRKVLLAVSGGVAARPLELVLGPALGAETGGQLTATAQQAKSPKDLAWDAWWWD